MYSGPIVDCDIHHDRPSKDALLPHLSAGNPTLDVSAEQARLFEWIVRGGAAAGLPGIVEGYLRAQAAATAARTA